MLFSVLAPIRVPGLKQLWGFVLVLQSGSWALTNSFWFVSEAPEMPAVPAAPASVPIELLTREVRTVQIEIVAVYRLTVSLVNSKTSRVLANI